MTDTIRATYATLDPEKRHHSFEILGFDFMLDDNFKVFLIEANTNPCLETTCPILHKVITDVVDSGLRIALDPLFPPPNYEKRQSTQIPLTQYELCFDGKIDNKEMDEIYKEYERRLEDIQMRKTMYDGKNNSELDTAAKTGDYSSETNPTSNERNREEPLLADILN